MDGYGGLTVEVGDAHDHNEGGRLGYRDPTQSNTAVFERMFGKYMLVFDMTEKLMTNCHNCVIELSGDFSDYKMERRCVWLIVRRTWTDQTPGAPA